MKIIDSVTKIGPLIADGLDLASLPKDHRLYPFARDCDDVLRHRNWVLRLHSESSSRRDNPDELCYFGDRLYIGHVGKDTRPSAKIICYTGNEPHRLVHDGNSDSLFSVAFAMRCVPYLPDLALPKDKGEQALLSLLMEADAVSHAYATTVAGTYKTYDDAANNLPNFLCAAREIIGGHAGAKPRKAPERFLWELSQHFAVEEILREAEEIRTDDPAMDHLARFLNARKGSPFYSGLTLIEGMREVNSRTKFGGFHEYAWQLLESSRDMGGAMAAEIELRLFREIKNQAGLPPSYAPRRPALLPVKANLSAVSERGTVLEFDFSKRRTHPAVVAPAPERS